MEIRISFLVMGKLRATDGKFPQAEDRAAALSEQKRRRIPPAPPTLLEDTFAEADRRAPESPPSVLVTVPYPEINPPTNATVAVRPGAVTTPVG